MNKKVLIIFLLVFFGLGLALYQYANEWHSDFANAYSSSKPANGHSWSEMECTSGLCVTADNKVGVGTDNPTEKFQVTGNIKASGDICNGTGNCLSALATLTNACGGAANSYVYTATAYSGTFCVMGAPTPASPSFPAQGGSTNWTCPVATGSPIICTASRGSPPEYLIGGIHTTAQCNGAVVETGSGKLCRMSGSTCPIGWQQLENWSTTTVSRTNLSITYGGQTCTNSIAPHAWSNKARESVCANVWKLQTRWTCGLNCCGESPGYEYSCRYTSDPCTAAKSAASDCETATITQVGCY